MSCQIMRLITGIAVLLVTPHLGCKSDPVNPIERDTATASDDIDNAVACREFLNLATDCGASEAYIQEAKNYCTRMDTVFIDSFNQNLMSCMSLISCEEFNAMMAAADAGVEGPDTDLSLDTNASTAVELCMLNAMFTVQPEQANIDFRQHYCSWAMQCDSSLTLSACESYFRTTELAAYLMIEAPYITEADKCVNPMPRCDEMEVNPCLEAAVEEVGTALDI